MHQRLNGRPVSVGGDTIAEGLAVRDVGELTFEIVLKEPFGPILDAFSNPIQPPFVMREKEASVDAAADAAADAGAEDSVVEELLLQPASTSRLAAAPATRSLRCIRKGPFSRGVRTAGMSTGGLLEP